MRVLICGGRDFFHLGILIYQMNSLMTDRGLKKEDMVVIQGEAKGADFLGKAWADWMGIEHEDYPADWKKHGKAAGHIRNKQMLEEGKPDLVVAFRGGYGTANMIKQAKDAGVEVLEVK